MKAFLSVTGRRLALLASVFGVLAAGLISGEAQSFTTPGGIGFSIAAGNYTAVLGGTNYFPVTLSQVNDGRNNYDGNSADGSYGCINDGFYDTYYEYEYLDNSDTYWTTNVNYGNYQYEYCDNSQTYWTSVNHGYYQYLNPITQGTWWTNTYSGDYEFQVWNGTQWVIQWSDADYDGYYGYEDITTGTDWWSDVNYGFCEYEDPLTQATTWTSTDNGDYQFQKYNFDGSSAGTYWTSTWNGAFHYVTGGWTSTYQGSFEYAEYNGNGTVTGNVWVDAYQGGEYYYEVWDWDDDYGWIDEGGYWSNVWSGTGYDENNGYTYVGLLDKMINNLDQEIINELVTQQWAKEIGEINQDMTQAQIDSETDYFYSAPWFVYSVGGRSAETTVWLSDNTGNNDVEFGSMVFVPLTDTQSLPLSYMDDNEAGPDIVGTLTVDDTDPNEDDDYYAYCYPDYIYSALDATGVANYKFYNPHTDMYATVDGGSEQYSEMDVLQTNAAQSVPFRITRTDNYNTRVVYYNICYTALDNNRTTTVTGSVSFASGGSTYYADIPVTNPYNGSPVSVTLTLDYAPNYNTDPYEIDSEYYSAEVVFLPDPLVNLTINGGSSMTVTESETPQTIPINLSVANLWFEDMIYFNVSGSAQNGVAYSAPWSGSSGTFYSTFEESGSLTIPVTSGANLTAAQTLTVSLVSDPQDYQIGTPASVTITFLPNTNNATTTGTGTANGGSAQTFLPMPGSYNNLNVGSQKNGAAGTLSNTVSGLPVALVNVQASSPYATASGSKGSFTITSSGWTNAFTVSYAISGTASPGVNYTTLSGALQFAANQTSTNLLVNVLTNTPLASAQTVVLTLNSGSNYYLGYNAQAVVTLLPNSSLSNSVASPSGRYWRGSGSDPTYWSQVIPLEYETGTIYSNLNGNCSALYPGLSSWNAQTLYHYNAASGLTQTNPANRIAFNNPILAFGERIGGTPLYYGQPYGFGIYAGNPLLTTTQIVIQAYYRTNNQLAGSISVASPNYFNTNSMVSYATNGFAVTTNAFGLSTTLSDSPGLNWGATSLGAYVLTHTASALASNYYYLVEVSGYPAAGTNAMTINASGAIAPSLLYTLEFEALPPWRSIFITQPQFAGSPMPPTYSGCTLADMLTNTPPVTNVVSFSPAGATNLDNSPELRRHPLLDNFVASMGNDPIALANYVINQIDLTDPMDYSDNGNISEQAINPGGVSRGALGTFMEKQGSAVDQCALLVYLLRQSGVPAVYEFAPRNGLKILDARLSQMLKFQIQGAVNEAGQLYTTNAMIAVNYPWVAAYIGTNWVHIFPWMKDYEITEGFNLYDYMPTNYSSAYPWVRDYIYGNTNLMGLAANGDNTPSVIFPAFLQKTLLQNNPGFSLSDLGVQILHRQHDYARWQDFPTPTWVTNVSTPLESLTSTGITNISPTLTNIFDTVSVQVYSIANPTNSIQTGNLRLVDLHNREFYIYQNTNSANHNLVQLSLILLPFRTNITTQLAYTNDSSLLSREVLTMNLGTNEMSLGVRFAYQRHRALGAANPLDPSLSFLGYQGCEAVNLERPLLKGDQAAICLDYGRVSQEMLNVYAMQIWQMENQVQLNPSLTNSISPDLYEGAVMYLAGMSYYKKVSDFNVVNGNLHKINLLSTWAAGLSKLGAARDSFGYLTNGLVIPVLPSVDMFYYETAMVGNGTVQPDSGQTAQMAQQNYNLVAIINNSAEEHQIINNFYQQSNAVSTVRLLQLSQNQASGIVPLNYNNYATQGQVAYRGHSLQSWDAGLWAQVANSLQNSPYTLAYMTPGPITNSAYAGMGALILGWNQWQALISPNSINGATGTPLDPNSVSPNNTGNYNLTPGEPFQVTFTPPASDTTTTPTSGTSANYPDNLNQIANGTTVDTPVSTGSYNQVGNLYNLPTGSGQNDANLYQTSASSGDPGNVGADQSTVGTFVSDPVGTITGEHYIDETDLRLPGPLPLSLRRNYSSQNLADNQFGTGWKLSILSYLTVTSGQTNIYAADMDGAVLAYVRTATNANVWIPTLAANPLLGNDSTAGVGGLANRLRDRIVQTVNGTATNYTLYGADGSTRVFMVISFNNGILNQTRPYLQTWADSRGNNYTFAYGTDSSQTSFGQLTRIQASNGNFLGFDYDVNAHIIDAYSGDGRWLYYDYDNYGDLVTVTLPDDTTRSYIYQHATQTVTNGVVVTYSTHLIIEEDKPEGRVLQNAYDSQRRVTNQMSTAGANLVPVRMASFIFSNNFAFTNSYTNFVSGYTLVIDGNGNTNRYDYTNSLITKITDPLGQTIQQTWYADNATVPGYPRSLSQVVDKRGLVTQLQYDSNGNITNTIIAGDLTGDGILTQTATNTALYNSNSLPVQMTDPAGNSTVIVYDPVFNYLPQQIIHYSGTTPVSTDWTIYSNASNVVVNGNVTRTNVALGLPVRQIRAYGSPDAATNDTAYNGNGFPSQTIRYTGTGDPAIINTFFYNERNEMVSQVDALGAVNSFQYDDMSRPTGRESIDEHGNLISWNYSYYNENGELNWVDGPAYNPEDYVWRDYDGAGRVSTEMHWRAEANPNGSGLEAPAGYNLYAQSFFQYDVIGNLTFSVNPRGVITTNTWDSLNRLTRRTVIETNGMTLTTESFGYEPGGLESFHTNALGGIAQIQYTTKGKPEYQINPDGSTAGWRYYLDGRPRMEIQRNGAYWLTTYDDVNLIVTRVFYNSSNIPLATNSMMLDRRGNVIQRVDAAFNVFTSSYDGLDRPKVSTGPATDTVSSQCTGMSPDCGIFVTNVLEQVTTHIYDAANRVLIVSNALGEQTITTRDMLGRVLSAQTFAPGASTPLRVTTYAYSADHHSVTTTEGSGPEAVVTTTFTDNDGHRVLAIGYPSTGASDFTLARYDLAGNLIHEEHDSSSGGTWTTANYVYDGLNRMVQKTDRDGAVTTLAYDPANNLTNRLMPGNLQWSATYNSASQQTKDWLTGSDGTSTTSVNTYNYYPAGNTLAGLLQIKTDGSSISATNSYDDWLRVVSVARSYGSPYGHLTTTYGYEVRGMVTNITEMNVGDITGPDPKVVSRSFDAYGQMISESITLNGTALSSASQGFDVAGRRTTLSLADSQGATMGYGYNWRSDGLLGGVSASSGQASYGYSTGGLLDSRAVGNRATTVTSRDGMGRPLAVYTTVNGQQALSETLAWTGDGLLGTHVLARQDFTDQRNYTYAPLSRRLTQEGLNLNAASRWTNAFAYDGGIPAGPGLLTSSGSASANSGSWSGGVSPFVRINKETNTVTRQSAYGRVNGRATVTATLDGNPIPVNISGTGNYSWTNQWSTVMELAPGAHQLSVSAMQPSGFFQTNASVQITNNVAQQADQIYRDGAGRITERVWTSPNGATNRTQFLTWDGKGRLCMVNEYDSQVNGFLWMAEYDGLDRLLCTSWYVTHQGGTMIAGVIAQTNTFCYDPLVRFLDLGAYVGPSGPDDMPGQTTWKLCGPDLNSIYGGMNGAGGLEATATGTSAFTPTVSDTRGNVLAVCNPTSGNITWNASRPTGYGAVPGYRPLPLGHGGTYAQSAAWRGKWADITGYIWLGNRFYDPVAGMWLSQDQQWNDRDPSYWSFCGGDPVNWFDPDGSASLFQMVFPATAYAAGATPWTGSLQRDIQYSRGSFAPAYGGAAVLGSPRVQGAMKAVGGAGEVTVGGAGLATTSPTIVGAVVSGAAVVHGADDLQAGLRQMWTGQDTSSFTEQGITAVTGSPTAGRMGDSLLGIGLSLGSGLLTQGARTGADGGRVTQFFDPEIGPGPTSTALTTPPTSGINWVFDGPWLTTPEATSWVAPSAAQDMNWLQRMMTGVGNYQNYVEFDAAAGSLSNPGGLKYLGGMSTWQQTMEGGSDLMNPIWGQLAPNYGEFGFFGQLGAQGGQALLSKH